jgi:hypothetical protein
MHIYLWSVVVAVVSYVFSSVKLRTRIPLPETPTDYLFFFMTGIGYTFVPVVNLLPIFTAAVLVFFPKVSTAIVSGCELE